MTNHSCPDIFCILLDFQERSNHWTLNQNLNEFGQMIRMAIAFSRFCPNLVHDETMQKESAFKVHYFLYIKDHNIKPHTI